MELALRQQLAVYSQKKSKPKITPLDRVFWITLSRSASTSVPRLPAPKPDPHPSSAGYGATSVLRSLRLILSGRLAHAIAQLDIVGLSARLQPCQRRTTQGSMDIDTPEGTF